MKLKYRKSVVALIALHLLIGISCNSFASKVKTISATEINVNPYQDIIKDREIIEGIITEGNNSNLVLNSAKTTYKFSAFHFINKDVGWACNKRYVFKTIDSGKKWKSFPIEFIEKGEIDSIHFADEFNGWLILNEEEADYSVNNQIRIYNTADGGKTWTISHTVKSVSLHEVYFKENDVWIIGTGTTEISSRSGPAVFYYSGEKSTWTDVSEPIKKLSHDSRYAENNFPSLGGIFVSNNDCVIVVNQVEKIFQSCDKGKSWEQIEIIGNTNRPDYYTKQIETKDDFIWTLQSIGAIEGISTLLTVIPNNPGENIRIFSLPGFFSSQGYSVSNQEFYLVGEKRSFENNTHNQVFILQTIDSGKTWNKILTDTDEIKFVQFSQSTIWILFENGTLNKLTKIE